ncbi:acyl-CoA synthetase [Corallococcus praedator]|uniref:Acyl-CoA synthetase n=1 Tax=Corallococcus praedator TaxID=2316724 RepID=A0ABX9QCH8_9BACT|nr:MULTISPECIES: AMP-binding protein [Corallococcus]RKH30217.1 acyl-CoA synthetase [Corallococcus sp. CA031C]RKH99827.1 acyl-CoA synthetase [Corallococcus praedator]
MPESSPRAPVDYATARRDFRWERPEHFNFATDVIDRHAAERPQAPALQWSDESGRSQRFTFQELKERSLHAARFLTGLGLKRGDRAFILMPRVPEWWFLVLGCIRAGIVFMPGTPMLTAKDIRYRLEAAHAKAVLTDASCLDRFEGVMDVLGVTTWVSTGDAPAPWTRYASEALAEGEAAAFPPTRAEDPLLIYFTSGTTGMPKMVQHTQASYGQGHLITGRYWLDLRPEDRHLTLSDTGWAKCAWGKLFGPWSEGACNVVYDFRGRFDPVAFLKVLERERVTTFCAPPTAWRALVLQDLKAVDLSSLRHTVSAGEPLNPEVIETWKEATGLFIREGYGQTETVVIVGMFPSLPPRMGSMGKPSPGFTVGVINEQGEEVADGQEGDIAVRVKPERPVGLFQGYLNDDAANAASSRGDWYVTGDRAVRDAEGYLWFVGRSDDVIKTSGYRVGPFEVESALLEHPAVAESAVIGVPDDKIGQRIKAYVLLTPGHTASPALAQELQDFVKKTTAPYKYPREIEFVSELPKTVSGKIRRAELRATQKK